MRIVPYMRRPWCAFRSSLILVVTIALRFLALSTLGLYLLRSRSGTWSHIVLVSTVGKHCWFCSFQKACKSTQKPKHAYRHTKNIQLLALLGGPLGPEGDRTFMNRISLPGLRCS